jgi:LL-diaminopimelate aminotransferase
MGGSFQVSNRLDALPPYLMADIRSRASALAGKGADIIDLSVGSPDFPPDQRIIETAAEMLREPGRHGYVIGRGEPEFRTAAAAYMHRRFGVEVDPEIQIVALLGSKEGLAHLPIAVCNPGDLGIYPDPGYLVYNPALQLAGVRPVPLKLDPEDGWRPLWDDLESTLANRKPSGEKGSDSRIGIVIHSYPHNPTSATVGHSDFDTAIDWARGQGAVTVNDNAYADIGFDGYRPPSILQAPAAIAGREGSRVVEFHSMSKTFSMAGWRCGFAVGDPDLITALARVKNFYDTGSLAAIQHGAATALDLADEIAPEVSLRYQKRRDLFLSVIAQLGLRCDTPVATIYIWARLPDSEPDDSAWCRDLLERAHVAICPGSSFGEQGRGYVRFAMTAPEDRLVEAVTRLEEFGRGS